jgi:hypothetical protein
MLAHIVYRQMCFLIYGYVSKINFVLSSEHLQYSFLVIGWQTT